MAELRAIKGKQQEIYDNNDRFYNQVREEQREIAKEIQQVKNYQVNQTMVYSARNKAIMDELAAVRECYTVWAHQQANSNLVEMPSHKSDLPPSDYAPPPSSSSDPQNPPN
ncbi:hypothetical protein PIB30_092884 [Stylosanthes scabra]|uniref:Uncharacterized protein n=1 Tax=Stylosanthes scabra TaxID=79078 RepID=A0ABU6ZTP4_9FABA|nr:hypothetical protein [Stylosanthes scabra]